MNNIYTMITCQNNKRNKKIAYQGPKVWFCGPEIAFNDRDEVKAIKTFYVNAKPFWKSWEHYFLPFCTLVFYTNNK